MPNARRRYTKRSGASTSRRVAPRRYRRRSGRSRRKGYSKVSPGRALWQNPLPTQRKFAFTYHDTGFTFGSNVGNSYFASRVFRGNSLFDPDFTGVGVQPYGYDNMCSANAPFGRYIVYGSKISVFPHLYTVGQAAQYTSGSYAVKFILWPSRLTSATYTGFDDLSRIPYHKARCIENADDAGGNNTLKQYVSTRKIFPEAGKLEDADFAANYNADPAKAWYWIIAMDSSTFNNDISGYCDVKIKYYCKLLKTDDVNES